MAARPSVAAVRRRVALDPNQAKEDRGTTAAAGGRPCHDHVCVGMRQVLIVAGVVPLALGLLPPWLGRLNLGGRLGDASAKRHGLRFDAPLGSSLQISVVPQFVPTPIRLAPTALRRRTHRWL